MTTRDPSSLVAVSLFSKRSILGRVGRFRGRRVDFRAGGVDFGVGGPILGKVWSRCLFGIFSRWYSRRCSTKWSCLVNPLTPLRMHLRFGQLRYTLLCVDLRCRVTSALRLNNLLARPIEFYDGSRASFGERKTAWLDTKDNLYAKAAPPRHAPSPRGRCS